MYADSRQPQPQLSKPSNNKDKREKNLTGTRQVRLTMKMREVVDFVVVTREVVQTRSRQAGFYRDDIVYVIRCLQVLIKLSVGM